MPSKCLNGRSCRERLAKEAFWSPATRGWKKDWEGHNSGGGGSLCLCTLGAARVPASLAAALPSCSTLTGAELPQAKKILRPWAQGSFGPVWLVATLWTVACQASLSGRGVLWAGILKCIGQYWFPCPSRALYLLLPQPTPLSTWCRQNPCNPAAAPPPHLALSGADPSLPGQPQEQTPVDISRGGPGAVWLRKKAQNPPTSWTSYRLNSHNQLGRLCVYGIYKRSLRAPTKENALVLIAVDAGGKNTEE